MPRRYCGRCGAPLPDGDAAGTCARCAADLAATTLRLPTADPAAVPSDAAWDAAPPPTADEPGWEVCEVAARAGGLYLCLGGRWFFGAVVLGPEPEWVAGVGAPAATGPPPDDRALAALDRLSRRLEGEGWEPERGRTARRWSRLLRRRLTGPEGPPLG